MPLIGPMSGEINMAPMMTAVEFMFSPTEATTMAKIRIQRLVPLNTMSLVMLSCILS